MEIRPGTTLHTILLYTVSDPGEWTAEDIADDLPTLEIDEIRTTIRTLMSRGLVHENSTDRRLWPRRAAKQVLSLAS